MYSIGIDVGGTNLPVGIVDLETKKILSKASTPFLKGMTPEAAMDAIAKLAKEQLDDLGLSMRDIAFAGIGIPGVMKPDQGLCVHANNLFWFDVDVVGLLKERLGCAVFTDNDANAAAWGEYIAGACRGTRTSVVLTLGTGLGGGVIIDGKMLWGSNYNGGELGHMIIAADDGIPCTCGNSGCAERYTAATALIKKGREALALNSSPMLAEACGGDENKIEAKTVIDCAKAGDPVCAAIFDNYVRYLAIFCLNMVNFLDPETIAIGGGVSNAGEFLMKPLREKLNDLIVNKDMPYAKVCLCELGSDAGIIGAALLGVDADGNLR